MCSKYKRPARWAGHCRQALHASAPVDGNPAPQVHHDGGHWADEENDTQEHEGLAAETVTHPPNPGGKEEGQQGAGNQVGPGAPHDDGGMSVAAGYWGRVNSELLALEELSSSS